VPADPFNVGLLGRGTVGSAFVVLLDERAGEIERFNDRRPVISGVLTRTQGDFEEILGRADLLVELMGGIEPAREYLLTAMRSGKDVVSANKLLLSQHGEELFETAREYGVRLRFEAAVAGVVPVVRVLERDRQRHDQLHPHRDGARLLLRGGAGRGAAQGVRRGRPQR
jgi:homoserine dehydrogenase